MTDETTRRPALPAAKIKAELRRGLQNIAINYDDRDFGDIRVSILHLRDQCDLLAWTLAKLLDRVEQGHD
jgi:hypothetical protein